MNDRELGSGSIFSLLSARSRDRSGKNVGIPLIYPALYGRIRTKKVPIVLDGFYPYGSVYNIEFSPSDKLAVTVCSFMAIAGYDPRRPVTKASCVVKHAHSDCVNCITFINDIHFATCSDDKTICLWDLRNLTSSTHTLRGHKDWVKNIEYNKDSNTLFSLAFDDGVRDWNLSSLNQYYHNDNPDNLAVQVEDPVRMRIAPDGSKMFITTKKSLCCVIDRFDGKTLADCQTTVKRLFKMDNVGVEMVKHNRPSVHVMSRFRADVNSFRSVMSVEFHPCSDMVALRYVDVKHMTYDKEVSVLYDLRNLNEEYNPISSFQQTSKKYLQHIEETSGVETGNIIKEFCFSRDGQLLASPQQKKVRLLAMDSHCTPMEIFNDERYHLSRKQVNPTFEVVNTITDECITSPVLSCRFAHHDCLLATGGLSGQFLFHTPSL